MTVGRLLSWCPTHRRAESTVYGQEVGKSAPTTDVKTSITMAMYGVNLRIWAVSFLLGLDGQPPGAQIHSSHVPSEFQPP